MNIREITFTGSFPNYRQCPNGLMPEYAFIGRSNVGKSSLINMLTNRRSLARVSSTPGKTQLLNYFLIDKKWFLVDLPGYGYAAVSKKKRREFEQMINQYLQRREMLQCTFVLIDLRIPPQAKDLEFMNWLGANAIPFVIAFTKADKLKKKEITQNLERFKEEMLKQWEELPTYFVTSAVKKEGRDEVLEFIEQLNQQFYEYHHAK